MANNKDLKALLAADDDPAVFAPFAQKYAGKTIAFDAYVGAVNDSTDLLLAGNHGPISASDPQGINGGSLSGPNFQIAATDAELGENVHVVATVGSYSSNNDLFHLTDARVTRR